MSDPLALMIDLERCTGCKSCEAACKQSNALGPHTYRNRVMWFSDQHTEQATPSLASLDFLTVTCQQCERPACLRACPVTPKAISKDPETGVVKIDTDRCTGCGECAISCPYGAIGYNADQHHAVKCDLCANRRENGGGPACASVCPTRAISYGKRSELLQKAEDNERDLLQHDHFLQKPVTIYLERTKKNYQQPTEHRIQFDQKLLKVMKDDKARANLGKAQIYNSYDKSFRQQHEPIAEQIIPGGCHICFNACPIKFHLRDGKIVNIYGNDQDPIFQGRICPKSQMTLQLYNSPNRLQQPLKRVGERGAGEFEPISWEQALDEIADKLRQVRQQYGRESLAIQAGSRTGVLNIMGTVPLFGSLWGTENVAATEPFCDLSKGVSLEMTQGSTTLANVYSKDDIGSAELYVYLGDNQAETRPVNFGMVNDWRLQNGTKMVVVDPRMTATATKADEWLPIRPGTDMALGLAMIHHILTNNLQDHDFCANWVLGFEQWRDFILEKAYTPDWAAPITDISAEQIRKLATEIAAADGCMIYLSRGLNQHTNATHTNRVFMFLAAITGNWGRPGGGYYNVSSEPDWRYPEIPADRKQPTRPAISKNPAAWADAMIPNRNEQLAPYPIKALITGNNPLGQWPNQNKAREALQHLDLLVHMELFRNDTSLYADYVLPMATGIEKGGTTRFAEDRRVIWNDKLIDAPGEAKSDHWFWIELGKRFGYDDILKEDYKDPRTLWDELVRPTTPAISGITTERMTALNNRCVRIPAAEPYGDSSATLYQAGTTAFGAEPGKRFPTPSGKLEFWSEQLESRFNALGLSALPEFYSEKDLLISLPHLSEAEAIEPVISSFFHNLNYVAPAAVTNPDDYGETRTDTDGFDTELVTGRPPAPHFHSWTHYFWQAQEMWPELYCQIHPNKAAELGIEDGDWLDIETVNGQIQARAWLHKGIRPAAVFVPIGWDSQQPYHPAKSVNFLTGMKLDPISQQANLKSHLCRVSPKRRSPIFRQEPKA